MELKIGDKIKWADQVLIPIEFEILAIDISKPRNEQILFGWQQPINNGRWCELWCNSYNQIVSDILSGHIIVIEKEPTIEPPKSLKRGYTFLLSS